MKKDYVISEEELRRTTGNAADLAKDLQKTLTEDPKAHIFSGRSKEKIEYIENVEKEYPSIIATIKRDYPYIQSLVDAQNADNHDDVVNAGKKEADQALKLMAEGNDPYSGELNVILGVIDAREHNDPSITEWMDKNRPAVQNQINAIDGYRAK